MGKYLLFHRHHVVKLLLWIGMECGDIHYVIECASCCSQCCFQVFKSKPHLFLKIRLRRAVCVTAYQPKSALQMVILFYLVALLNSRMDYSGL